jgi:hypothetical protein
MTDNPSPFTPRSSHPSATKSKSSAQTPPVLQPDPFAAWWKVWKPRLAKLMRGIGRILVRLATWVISYVNRLSRTQRIQHILIIVGLVVCAAFVSHITSRTRHTPVVTQDASSGITLPKETPDFTTILPSGTSIDDFGGWTRVSPSDRNSVYAYPDTLDGISIIVSEQPIPDSFKSDLTGSLETLSQSYSAERTFDASGITVHIGKSAKGPQSLIFVKKNLLVLIKSSGTVSDETWKTYIESLR